MHNSTETHNTQWDALWVNVNLATMAIDAQGCGVIREGAIAVTDGRVAWLGEAAELPEQPARCATRIYDGKGQWLTPGLVDCHTHLVYGGNRANEFEMRLKGVDYEDIARQGGGIRATVTATRNATENQLVELAASRLQPLLAEGVTTVEIKSGYGLSLDTELTMLRVAKTLSRRFPVTVSTTFLGAHAVPEEFEGRRAAYVQLLCEQMLPAVAKYKLADAVDVFCESIGFSISETEKILTAATQLGFNVKLHADQLSDTGGAALAARFNALSADHIEYASLTGVEAMAKHGTVAVLLPGAFYYLRESQLPPIESLNALNVPIAIATDSNPGSSPSVSLLLMMNMACTLFALTPEQVLRGVTINAAKALGLHDQLGSLDVGKRADFALWNIQELAELCYWMGANHCSAVIKGGVYVLNKN